jgi:hypothetical protein
MTAVLPHVAAAERLRQLPSLLSRIKGCGEAIGALAKGQPASFDGVWGSACALVAASLGQQATGPLVLVCPTARQADDLAADLELFTGVEPAVYPAWESEADERLVHDETFGERLRVLKGLLTAGRGQIPLPPGEGAERSEAGEGRQAAASRLSAGGSGLSRFIKARSASQTGDTVPSTEYSVQSASEESSTEPRLETGTKDRGAERAFPAAPILVTSIQALLQPAPAVAAIAAGTRVIRRGERIDVEGFLKWLVERGFHHTTAVELPGEFSHRGGIIDIFAPDWRRPVRIELFDDEIESLRSFEVATQRSAETLDAIEVTVLRSGVHEIPLPPGEGAERSEAGEGSQELGDTRLQVRDPHPRPLPKGEGTIQSHAPGHLADYLPPESWFLLAEPDRIAEEGKNYLQRVDHPAAFHSVAAVLAACSRFAVATSAELAASTAGVHCHLPFESIERFSGDISRVREELDAMAA